MKPRSVFTHYIFHEENASYEMLFILLRATEEHNVPWNDSEALLPEQLQGQIQEVKAPRHLNTPTYCW